SLLTVPTPYHAPHPFPTRRSSDLAKSNVIPPEASAGIDCRMLAGDDPQEIVGWVRRVIDDDQVEVTITGEPKIPNLSPVIVTSTDRKSTRLNSSHEWISYAVFCLK